MKPNIRSITLVLAALLLSLFWMDRGVYRTWIADHGLTVRYYMLSFCLHHSPVIWPGITYWDMCGHADGSYSSQPGQLLSYGHKRSDHTADLAEFARLAMIGKRLPLYLDDSSSKMKQLEINIAFLKRGKQIDPSNALYNLLQSRALLTSSIAYVARPKKSHSDQQGWRIVISDSKLFHEGIRQFQVAQKKQLRLYEYDRLEADFGKLPIPLLWEHYELRRTMDDEYGRQIYEILSPDTIIDAAQFYMEKGDPLTARKLLDIKAYGNMMLTDKQASESRQHNVSEFCVRGEAIMAGKPQASMDPQISPYPGMPATRGEFLPVSHRSQTEEMMSPWIGWDAINVVIQQQAVWVWMCFGLALLVIISLIRDIAWLIAYRIKRKSVAEFIWPHQPSRLALGFTLAAMVLTVAQIAALHIWADDVTAVWRRTQYVAPLLLIVGWISVRFEFKRNCQLQGIRVPGRWVEMLYNWLPVTGFTGLYAISVYLSSLRMDWVERYLLLFVAVCLFSAAMIPLLSRKYRIQDYYILANRVTRRFLAWMVVFISISVMPLQILHEVVLLRSDHTGTGAFRSVGLMQKLDQAANREYMQKIDGYLKSNRR